MGVFPTALTTAAVKPLLKRNNLDPSTLSNYRPVSNLPFLSNILEKLVCYQLNDFTHTIYEMYQSGFRTNHCNETALVKIVNDLRLNLVRMKPSILVLLNSRAAFDTVDHPILLDKHHNQVWISGSVFNWFKSYLTDRKMFISIEGYSSKS